MRGDWILFFFLLFGTERSRATGKQEAREKRQILYPPPIVYPLGGNFKLIVGLAVPVHLSGRILVYGQNIQFQYMLPDNATFFTNFFENSSRRRRRNAGWNERTPIYEIFERELDRRNIDGKSCLMKNICEVAASPLKNDGLIGELLHLLFTPDHGNDGTMDQEYLDAADAGRRHEDCSTIYSSCPAGLGILDRISKIY